jgi:hypothetical protein
MERLHGQRRGAKKYHPIICIPACLIRGIVKNQNPKRVCEAGYHQESRQRRAGQFPVPIRTLGIPRHRVAYRGDNPCRFLYPINGLLRSTLPAT